MSKFGQAQITDQKRLVRGEHLLYARSRLRVRDLVHHKKWRVMMMAGSSPAGEINAIRELMPQAQIVAVDRDAQCLERAIECGADDVICCDLAAFTDQTTLQKRWHSRNNAPPKELLDAPNFDLIDLDLCANANHLTRELIGVYRWKLTSKGVLMVTFSYGRDIEELFHDAVAQAASRTKEILESLERDGIPRSVCGRIAYLCTTGLMETLHSVMLYRGSNMPMCSLLFQANTYLESYPSAVKAGAGDFELAAVYPDAANLYDCPQERIEALRRRFAAIKASLTRKEKTKREVNLYIHSGSDEPIIVPLPV